MRHKVKEAGQPLNYACARGLYLFIYFVCMLYDMYPCHFDFSLEVNESSSPEDEVKGYKVLNV